MSEELTAEERVDGLATLVNDALRLLAKSALTLDEGCRIAARAWWLARPVAPDAANRLNATLHRLSKGDYSWDSLEQGPEAWRVRIGRPAG